ncbi:hypothetical protein SLS53_004917 [Cytospora paraplurivora]|uniref:Major facilitator superfamily (MFS) profile domain-containing protein n=1 Tax=Cytospora paraplurivora TaxID=2898453 RepID=A0AAN9YFX0_9PEZI
MAGIIGADNRFAKDFNNPNADMQGNITGLYDIGCVLGSITCYFLGERFGRRTMLITGGIIMIIGSALLGSSYTIAQLLVGRIVTGFGNGMNSSTAPVYQSECSPASIRGALLTLQGTVTILGVVIAYWTDFGTNGYSSSFEWRFPLSLQALFAVFLILQVIGLPETPRWLVAHDRHEEARAVVAAITEQSIDDAAVGRTILDIQLQLEEENKEGPFHIREIFSWGELQNLRRLLLIISVQLGQQFSGSNMINYYLPVILQDIVGLDRNLSLILSGCVQCTYLVGSAIPVFLMDRYGPNIGWRTFIIFAVLNAFFIPMVYLFYPETKGLELEDIPLLFSKGGITGGVFSSRGKTVTPGQHADESDLKEKVENIEDVGATV